MTSLRQIDHYLKQYACFALLAGAACVLAAWLMAQPVSTPLKPGVRTVLWLCILALPCLAAAMASWLGRDLKHALQAAAGMAEKVAAGDLSSKAAGMEAGPAQALLRGMQQMNDKLVGMVVDVRAGTESIASSAGQIAAASMDLSARTEEQAASLEETATSMEQLTATVKQNAEHAHQASKLALSASEVAVKGGAVVAEVVGTMASINDSSRRIAEIIGVIDGIAFQTNILALNAAVEAARAGEQGRGFAVVASEVRNLAQRSAAAAKEIKILIDDSVAKVSAGTELADKAGKTMDDVVTSVKRVSAIIVEIADASAEQTVGIEQVNVAIAAMDQATQHNAALVEQAAAAAASMRDRAASLSRASGAFVLGAGHASCPPAIHLVASNPNKVSGRRADARVRPTVVPVRAVASRALVPATPLRGRGRAAPQDVDWQEF